MTASAARLTFGRSLTDDEVLSLSLPDVFADDYAATVPVFRSPATYRP